MKKPTKKPAKGVPMPSLDCVECFWIEDDDELRPGAILKPLDLRYEDVRYLMPDIARAKKWLANPATPKGVRR